MRNFFQNEDGENDAYGEGEDRLFGMEDFFQGGEDDNLGVEFVTHVNLNRMILESALRVVEGSFWTRFRRHTVRLQMLKDTYRQIHDLLVADLLEEKDDELDAELMDIKDDPEKDIESEE